MCIIKFDPEFFSPRGVKATSSASDRKIESTNPAVADFVNFYIFQIQP